MEEAMTAARLYRLGRGYYKIRNYERAQSYLMEAVIRGSSSAVRLLYHIGYLFFCCKEYDRAEDCFQILADRGDARSCFYLGLMCRNGLGRRPDVARAFDYFSEAYQRGEPRGALQAGLLIARDAFRYEEAREAAIEWLTIAEEEGIPEAGRHIGLLLCDNLPEHNAEALKWFLKAAGKGDARSMVYASDLYLSGVGVARNEKIALTLLYQAADRGDCKASMILGDLYASGTYVQRDSTLAKQYYARARQVRDAGQAEKETP